MSNLLEIYTPKELAIMTCKDLEKRKEKARRLAKEFDDYHYDVVTKAANARRHKSKRMNFN